MAALDCWELIAENNITVSNSSVDLTVGGVFSTANIEQADMVKITPHADLYYLEGGTTVTTTKYHIMPGEMTQEIVGVKRVHGIRMIRPGSSDVVTTVSLWRYVPGGLSL